MSVLTDLKTKLESLADRHTSLAQEATNLKADVDAAASAVEAELNRIPTLQDVVDLVARVPR